MDPNAMLPVRPIGIIHTPYFEKPDTPRQPGMDNRLVLGTVELNPALDFEQALEDLEGFEKIWILSWFHKVSGWKTKVLPPGSDRKKRGVFATRSPHRPNPIGLSLCDLIEVQGRTITVQGPDLLDGTPVLDLKPYLPAIEAFPEAGGGWTDEPGRQLADFTVTFAPVALEQGEWMLKQCNIDLLDRARMILGRDPFPHPYRRTSRLTSGSYVLAIKSWRLDYRIVDRAVIVEKVRSGYELPHESTVENQNQPIDHLLFISKWPSEPTPRS